MFGIACPNCPCGGSPSTLPVPPYLGFHCSICNSIYDYTHSSLMETVAIVHNPVKDLLGYTKFMEKVINYNQAEINSARARIDTIREEINRISSKKE